MSNVGNNEAPILGAEGRSSEVGLDAWVYTPTRKAGKFAKWRNPIGRTFARMVCVLPTRRRDRTSPPLSKLPKTRQIWAWSQMASRSYIA